MSLHRLWNLLFILKPKVLKRFLFSSGVGVLLIASKSSHPIGVLSAFTLMIIWLLWAHILRFIAYRLTYTVNIGPLHKTLLFISLEYFVAASFLYASTILYNFFPAYFIFLSALWISVHTDLQHMLISRFATIFLVPIAFILSFFGYLNIPLTESIASAAAGYLFLLTINAIFKLIKKHDGLGQGDIELLACIGAFTGFLGCWFAILFGSTIGTLAGCIYMLITQKKIQLLPFGPFLALGAMIFLFFKAPIIEAAWSKFVQ